jgi:TolB-like protein
MSSHRFGAGNGPVIRMLGGLRLYRDGVPLALPTSRKARALLAYLALAPRPQSRSQLCELLWDSPADPRGELRWCLTKIRGLLDDEECRRVVARDDTVRFDLGDCFVDTLAVLRAADGQMETLAIERQRDLETLFDGDFLEGLDMSATPAFDGWLLAQRRRFRVLHTALLERLVGPMPDDGGFGYLDKWRELAPFDQRVHEIYLSALARRGQVREAEEHVAVTVRRFDAEGLGTERVRAAWRSARQRLERETITVAPQVARGSARPRSSIAIMPFADASKETTALGGTGRALAHDVTTRLAKLRSFLVIAQGTTRALCERGASFEEVRRALEVDYVVTGVVRVERDRLIVSVELAEAGSAHIVWAEKYDGALADTLAVLDEIGNSIVARIAAEIDMLERNRAILKPPGSLDAWQACHRGLWHMYQYRKSHNDKARHFFERALELDPTFSRAYAGLSFTHFQDAFQNWALREPHIDKAHEAAERGLMADEHDPAVHWALGRALYLQRRWEQSESELMRSIDLSPNFALGHYNLSFVRSVVGDPHVAIADADLSRRLSPYDPMLFGMLATRAISLARLEQFDEASVWAVEAAARPNAFPHIHAIAAYTLALAGSVERARGYAAAARRVTPRYGISDFLLTFPFEAGGEALFRKGAKLVGME